MKQHWYDDDSAQRMCFIKTHGLIRKPWFEYGLANYSSVCVFHIRLVVSVAFQQTHEKHNEGAT